VIVDGKDTSTKDLPARWGFKDEWYNLVPFPTRVRFLATVDEKTYGAATPFQSPPPPGVGPRQPPGPRLPRAIGADPGHGSFHPVAWCQYYDGGKVWATTLGHDAAALAADAKEPGAREFQALIVGGIKSAMGAAPFCQ
jgi:hypothetical protein